MTQAALGLWFATGAIIAFGLSLVSAALIVLNMLGCCA
jgi:hypothetical protein